MDELLTVNEVTKKLKITKATLYRYMAEGVLISYKIQGNRRFKTKDIETLIEGSKDEK